MKFAPQILAAMVLSFVVACSGGDNGGSDAAYANVDPYFGDVMLGEADAPVEIVEYASLTCPACRNFWKQVFPRLKANYIDTGKVKYVMKDWPTDADLSVAGVGLVRCAGRDKYYDLVDEYFTRLADLFDAARVGGAGPVLVEIGAAHGLSTDQVRACIDHPGVRTHLERTQTESGGRVRATPTVFVNDEHIADHSYAGISAAIDAALGVTADDSTEAAEQQ